MTDEGFRPLAIDRDANVVYGLDKYGADKALQRLALFKVSLDGSEERSLVLSHPGVDIDGIITVGRQHKPIGATYVTEKRNFTYFDPKMETLRKSLEKALPQDPLIAVADCTVDEQTLLVFAGSDNRPGAYYVLNRAAKSMSPVLAVRPQVDELPLARMQHVTYPAADGTPIPAYLTLPSTGAAKNLPAIVMPHGGPSARDEWGFDWLSQYFAAMGYAVLQPNYRGSTGFGDAWRNGNGFKSWRTAVGDVNDAGRWLVSQGIADRAKLGVVGWSYGGYAALQASVVDPGLFKAVVAIAPVTDLAALSSEYNRSTGQMMARDYFGSISNLQEGSPTRHAALIKAPVLMFHGALDVNVNIDQSRRMAKALTEAGGRHRLVTWDGLDHQLQDSEARAMMLRTSNEWLKAAFERHSTPTP